MESKYARQDDIPIRDFNDLFAGSTNEVPILPVSTQVNDVNVYSKLSMFCFLNKMLWVASQQ